MSNNKTAKPEKVNALGGQYSMHSRSDVTQTKYPTYYNLFI